MTYQEHVAYLSDWRAHLRREWRAGQYWLVFTKRLNIALIPLRVYSMHYVRKAAHWVLRVTAEKRL